MENKTIESLPVTCHADYITHNSIFVVIQGFRENGAAFIPQAISKGASCIIAGNDNALAREYEKKYSSVPFLFVDDPREQLAFRSAQAYDNKTLELPLIGVTGTKGKTTTTFLIEYILKTKGYNVGLAGTIKNSIGECTAISSHATMQSDLL